MTRREEWEDLTTQARTFTTWIIAILLDTTFLSLWTTAQWLTSKLVSRLALSGIDQWALITFQVIFAISTLSVVLIYIIGDILIMFHRTRRRVRAEQLRTQAERNRAEQ